MADTTKWYIRLFDRVKPKAIKIVDRIAQYVAGAFILGTSFLYVRNWLQDNRADHDLSLVGAIMVLSIALYLFVRKR